MRIPVYKPLFKGNEKRYLRQAINSSWVSSEGYFVQKFEEEFAKWSGNRYAVAVCNGTAALETAIWSLNNAEYVHMPTSTIISCLIPLFRLNRKPIFYDNAQRNEFYGKYMDYPVLRCHLFGKYARFSGNIIIDDASQYWQPFKAQNIACYSLFANKLITSGEGGIVVTNKKEIYERAKQYRNLCHSKERFIHNDLGYNFRMSNLQGAVALAQLEQIDKFTAIKQKNRDLYKKYFPDNAKILFDVKVPWMYLVETKYDAGKIIKKLNQKGIDCRRFFYPLHKQPCLNGKYVHLDFSGSEFAWEHWFYLPSGLTLTEKEIRYICHCLKITLATMA